MGLRITLSDQDISVLNQAIEAAKKGLMLDSTAQDIGREILTKLKEKLNRKDKNEKPQTES